MRIISLSFRLVMCLMARAQGLIDGMHDWAQGVIWKELSVSLI